MEVDLNVRAELEWVIFVFIRNIDEKSTDDIMREVYRISIETLRHIYKIHKHGQSRDSAITANYNAYRLVRVHVCRCRATCMQCVYATGSWPVYKLIVSTCRRDCTQRNDATHSHVARSFRTSSLIPTGLAMGSLLSARAPASSSTH